MTAAPSIVLASASPRRADLIRQLGLEAELRPADVNESYLPGEAPKEHVERLARAKARAAALEYPAPGTLIVGGDTVVVSEGRVLGKPAGREDAVEMLCALSGREHEVLSGLAVASESGTLSGVEGARVRFRAFDELEARAYVATGEPLDKAGAYGIQGLGAALVEEIRGDYYSIVGFPVSLFLALLERSGWRYAFGRLESAD